MPISDSGDDKGLVAEQAGPGDGGLGFMLASFSIARPPVVRAAPEPFRST